MLPSWIRSRSSRPRLVYFLAIEATKRRLASVSSFSACSATASPHKMCCCVRLNLVKPTLLEIPICFNSDRRDDFLDRPGVFPELLADCQQLLNHDGRPRDGLEDQHLPALDALGNGRLAFPRWQRHLAHLAQVHAHRVLRLLQYARSQV